MSDDKNFRVTIEQKVGMTYSGIFKGMDPLDKNYMLLDMGMRVRRFPRSGIVKMIRSDGVDMLHLLRPELAPKK